MLDIQNNVLATNFGFRAIDETNPIIIQALWASNVWFDIWNYSFLFKNCDLDKGWIAKVKRTNDKSLAALQQFVNLQ